MAYRRVLRSQDLPSGEGSGSRGGQRLRDEALETTVSRPVFHTVEISGDEVLLTRLASGEVVAFEALCPHQAIPLNTGSVFDGYVRCPQHYYLYDPRTGRNILPTQDASPATLCRLKPGHLTTYPVQEQDGWILVGGEPNPPPPAPAQPAEAAQPTPPACTSPAGRDPVERPCEAVVATAGTEVALDLLTDVRPGCLWHVTVSGPAVTMRGQTFQDSRTRVRLTPVAQGEATVRCAYAMPWSDRPLEVRNFSVRVTAACPDG